jgi:tripartite ATP-independent transporter DctM subunit
MSTALKIENNTVTLNRLAMVSNFARLTEDSLTAAALLGLSVLPVLELALRAFFNTGIPGSSNYVQNLTLWVGFLGAIVASRERRHLSLSNGLMIFPSHLNGIATVLVATVSTAVASGLFWASLQFVRAEMESPASIAGWLPIWVVESILPAAFAIIVLRFVAHAGWWWERTCAFLGIPMAAMTGFILGPYAPELLWPGIGVLIGAALVGAPIFVVLGGVALLLFFADGVPVASIPVETYRIVVSPSIPTIPLFTLTGYILAEGKASQRLVHLFRALFGWMPGGLAIAATLVCAFFTTFTGASGVTILALGGLLLPVLIKNGYLERFSMGLLTSTGSLGLLFPPSLAVILYGVVAHVPIPDLFKAGIVPGFLLVSAVAIFSVREGLRSQVPRAVFHTREAMGALWESKWEILLPVVALVAIFGGFCTLIEAAAITVVYALVVETLIHRELHFTRDLPRVLLQCVTLIGGVFVILGVAMGLTNYLVDAEVPMKAAEWVQAHIHSRVLFLLTLNLFLLIVGCLMDIFSAIVVVVPLILPIGQAFGIHPLHLGMIFLANLELGYLTPPVGMNLFLASYRFDKPLVQVYRNAIPFFLVLLLVVLLITYIPALTIGAVGTVR